MGCGAWRTGWIGPRSAFGFADHQLIGWLEFEPATFSVFADLNAGQNVANIIISDFVLIRRCIFNRCAITMPLRRESVRSNASRDGTVRANDDGVTGIDAWRSVGVVDHCHALRRAMISVSCSLSLST